MFYIIGCARSGTTAIAKILGRCENVEVGIELLPNLCIESRNLYQNNLKINPKTVLTEARKNQIQQVNNKGKIFADKNVNYLPFIPHMSKLWNPKYLFVIRDGKDVVRSLMDWHSLSRGNIFGRKEDDITSKVVKPEQDWWDYSRIRPLVGETYYDEWPNLSRFEKCSWYWNKYNLELLKQMDSIPDEKKMTIKLSSSNVDEILEVMNFLNLKPLKIEEINFLLKKRINSSKDRFNIEENFPRKLNWSNDLNLKFEKFAGKLYEELGFN